LAVVLAKFVRCAVGVGGAVARGSCYTLVFFAVLICRAVTIFVAFCSDAKALLTDPASLTIVIRSTGWGSLALTVCANHPLVACRVIGTWRV